MWGVVWNDNYIAITQIAGIGMRAVLLIAGLVLCCLNLIHSSGKMDGLRAVVMGTFAYFAEYIVVSGILFRLDVFHIVTALVLVDAVNAAFRFLQWKKGMPGQVVWRLKENICPLLICMLGLVLIHNKNELYGMQQDQGVYQTAAIALMYGETSNQKTLEEYEELTEEDQSRFQYFMPTELNGFYFYNEELEELYTTEFETEASGYFHGIATFPALLALWGSIFGLSNMSGIQGVFLCILLFLSYYIMKSLKCKNWIATAGTAVIALSPLIVWVGKSALTELFLACAVAMFVDMMMYENRVAVLYSVLAVLSFAFLHISIYTIMPIIVVIYFAMFVKTHKRIYLSACAIATAGFCISMETVKTVSTEYFYLNIQPLLNLLGFLGKEQIMGAITIFSVLVILFCLLGIFMRKQPRWVNTVVTKMQSGKILAVVSKKRDFLLNQAIRVLLAVIAVLLLFQVSRVAAGYEADSLGWQHATIVGFSYMAGMIVLPFAIIMMLLKPQVIYKNKKNTVIFVMFLYCILLYSMLLRREIQYYYYYGRYLVPFIAIIVWQGALMLSCITVKYAAVGGCIAGAVLQVFCVLPFDIMLMNQKDDTRMQWSVLEKICSIVGEEDTIVISDELVKTCMLPIKYMTGARVIPQLNHLPKEQMDNYYGGQGNTYYLSEGDVILQDTITIYRDEYETSEDTFGETSTVLGQPLSMTQAEHKMQLHKLMPYQYIYTADEEDGIWINMGSLQEDGSRWGAGSVYGLNACLRSADYHVFIKQAEQVPMEIYGVEDYPISIYVNGQYLVDIKVYRADGLADITFDIPSYYLTDGVNEILIKSSPWSPEEFLQEDYRAMGINIKEIKFEKQ